MESIAKLFTPAEERAADREERMRMLELEMEERRMDREVRREDRILSMFTSLMQPMMGGYMNGPTPFLQGLPYLPPAQLPHFLYIPPSPEPPETSPPLNTINN